MLAVKNRRPSEDAFGSRLAIDWNFDDGLIIDGHIVGKRIGKVLIIVFILKKKEGD